MEFEITQEMIKEFKFSEKRVTGEHVIPAVIEPSFGIGRILYSLLEHSYYCRENDVQRTVLSLPPLIAPVKVSVLPLLNDEKLLKIIPTITSILNTLGISSKVDDVGQAIGKRYARTDEIGIPFALTIDFTGLDENTITLRERDSCAQVRIKIDQVGSILSLLIEGKLTWIDVWNQYPHVDVSKEN